MMGQFWSWFSRVVLIGSIAITGLLLLPLTTFGKQWYQLIIVDSGSMAPVLPVGSLVIVIPQQTYAVGDIIAFKQTFAGKDQLIIHRIIGMSEHKTEGIFLAAGDVASSAEPQVVVPEEIIGKVNGVIPQIGYVLLWLQSGTALGWLVGGLLIVMIAGEATAFVRSHED